MHRRALKLSRGQNSEEPPVFPVPRYHPDQQEKCIGPHVAGRPAARRAFLEGLAESCETFALEIHAYCLMGNHYHLLARTRRGNLGQAMRYLGSAYTQRYNRAHSIDGPLFRGRYQAILVAADGYLQQLSR